MKHRPPACNEQIAGALKPTRPGHQAMGGRRQINSAPGAKYCEAQQILDIGQTAPMTGKEKWLQCALCREILARQLPATQRLILFHVGKSPESSRVDPLFKDYIQCLRGWRHLCLMILPTGCLGSSPLEMGRCRRD